MATVTTTIAMVIAVKLNFVLLEPRTPFADTLSRVMGLINSTALQRSFIARMKDCHTLRMAKLLLSKAKYYWALMTARGEKNDSRGERFCY